VGSYEGAYILIICFFLLKEMFIFFKGWRDWFLSWIVFAKRVGKKKEKKGKETEKIKQTKNKLKKNCKLYLLEDKDQTDYTLCFPMLKS
jgi:hypothetical protein